MKDELMEGIQALCLSKGWTLTLAESCTGGSLAARVTAVPGSSEYFPGSLVTYSNTLKNELLGVSGEMLARHGAVSQPVVEQMARGALDLIKADFSIATSGIAGPGGGTKEKPVGTVWGAIGIRGEEPLSWNFRLSGTRKEIIEKAVETLLLKFKELLESRCSL